MQANNAESKVTCAPLQWGQNTESLEPPYDVIIASDLLYEVEQIPKLMLTIVSLSDSDTVTYLAFELRPNIIRPAFQAIRDYGLKFRQVLRVLEQMLCVCIDCATDVANLQYLHIDGGSMPEKLLDVDCSSC